MKTKRKYTFVPSPLRKDGKLLVPLPVMPEDVAHTIKPLKMPSFNLFIMPDDVLSWAATPHKIQLRLTHSQSCLLIDKITAHHRKTNPIKSK